VVFYDFLYKNVKLNYDGVEKIRILLHNEELIEDELFLMLILLEFGNYYDTAISSMMQKKQYE
jgi:hypothetical protein